MPNLVYDGQIEGEFEGLSGETVFKMHNGTYWVQAQYKYWYHHAYNPRVTITQEGGGCVLSVAGNSVPVRRVTGMIESKINGEFTGWEGDTQYELLNGQVWKQSNYRYEYKYPYMPDAVVCPVGSGYGMLVAGTVADVCRVR